MTSECFAKQVDRLKSTYGEKNYSPERVKTLFRRLSGWSDDDFATAVENLIVKARSAPLGEELLEEMELVKKQKQADYYNYLGKSKSPMDAMKEAEKITARQIPNL
jgi:hypothetical protein